ncbi:hypothetical protein HPP92_017774 [Vanilla planifolia]|uniref:Molybdenum cofactor sulfurase n=1 Tax=Vanilla planifolia TaxID=51239 RepID=A0A835UK72_VANPL|nr:hypothetical protein HPP92_017774 [Vanilla planifolia]
MHPSLWKPLSNCAAIILNKKKASVREDDDVSKDSGKQRRHSILRRLQERTLRRSLGEAPVNGSLATSYDIDPAAVESSADRPRSLVGHDAQKEFLRDTSRTVCDTFDSFDSIPGLEECYGNFMSVYPSYQSSDTIDQLRSEEYGHLDEDGAKVCLDYCGFGLFSYKQSFSSSNSSGFSLSKITANLNNHAIQGGAKEGTAEHDIKTQILEFLNIPKNEYDLVFTESRGMAFRLLAESYPFQHKKKLLTMFDHDSQSVIWMAQKAREKGATVYNASFKWPTLKVCNSDLRKLLSRKKKRTRKRDSSVGLFVFPVQSRVSGVKYPYQWMAIAQQNNWHCLLDAGSLGPKGMNSLGLSLYQPDFIITSFYRVFGDDPSGFGCLLIKKSELGCLVDQNGGAGFGMVRITPIFPDYLSESFDANEQQIKEDERTMVTVPNRQSQMPAFSGAYTLAEVGDVIETETNQENGSREDSASTSIDGGSLLFGKVMKSPLFSDDELSDNSLWIDVGQSPCGSDYSGLLRGANLGSAVPPPWFSTSKPCDRESLEMTARKNPTYEDTIEEAETTARGMQEESFTSACGDKSEIFKERALDMGGSALRREADAGFSLSGRMKAQTIMFNGNKLISEEIISRRVSFSMKVVKPEVSFDRNSTEREALENHIAEEDEDDYSSYEDEEGSRRREPEIVCRYIDHVNMIDQSKITLRLRYLVNWLVTSLLHLRLPASNGGDGLPLVRIYGPKIKFERGASVAFNVRHRTGGLVHPETVQKMAERSGISLGIGFLCHVRVDREAVDGLVELADPSLCVPMSNGLHGDENATIKLIVVTASLGFLTNFEDVYKMWAFLARFLDPVFVESDGLSTVTEITET